MEKEEVYIIGIAGGSASGKSTVCRHIMQELRGEPGIVMLGLDEFYRDLTEKERGDISHVNFDVPDAFDVKTVVTCLDALKAGDTFEVPVYDFKTSRRDPVKTRHVGPARIVAIEGILTLSIEPIFSRCDMRIFVDTDDDVRLIRRIKRDTVDRGRAVDNVLIQYERFVKPAFDQYVFPSRQRADIVLPCFRRNTVGIDVVTVYLRHKLHMPALPATQVQVLMKQRDMQQQVKTQNSLIELRTHSISREEFVEHANRVSRMAVETAMNTLRTDLIHSAKIGTITSISWDKAGQAMELVLDECVHKIDRKTRKILAETIPPAPPEPRSPESKEPRPPEVIRDVKKSGVKPNPWCNSFLLAPVMVSPRELLNVLRVLSVERPADRFFLLSIFASTQGVAQVLREFPDVVIIVGEIVMEGIDPLAFELEKTFADRYFGARVDELEERKAGDRKSASPKKGPVDRPSGELNLRIGSISARLDWKYAT